jgi:uroporphyrinogen decarboxylase
MTNKRELLLNLVHNSGPTDYIPAAFFLHFDSTYHQGQAAINKHMEFFRFTGMDFVKIQYEQALPATDPIRTPQDWGHVPLYPPEFFDETIQVVAGLIKAASHEALVVMTLYSPFMWARYIAGDDILNEHLKENPEAVKTGLEILTANVLNLARGCMQAGVDGFYASSQGGEAIRFGSTEIFERYIKPTDLAVWGEIQSRPFNILHICDYEGGYDDLSPFQDYPGHVINSSLNLGERSLSPREVSQMFGRPFMGGMERLGVIATGSEEEVRREAEAVLKQAPEHFILAADCTVPGDTPWENLKTAIHTAHNFSR